MANAAIAGSARASLTRRAARSHIVAAWRQYGRKPGANLDMEMGSFFRWIEANRPELLRFHCRASKWELVRGWLERAEYSCGA